MVRKKATKRQRPEGLASHTANNKLAHLAKVDSAMASIERDVKSGKLLVHEVTWILLLKERAGVGHRYLDAPGQKKKKSLVEHWLAEELPKMAPVAAESQEAENVRLKDEIEDLHRRLDRMGDRIHFYSARIRQQLRTIKTLKEKSLETVVHINR
ncbi:hypothetical protein [Rhizobium leguminosarum]